MKNIKYSISIIMLIILITCGCSHNNFEIDYSDTYIFGQDSQETFMGFQNKAYMAESEDSYYYMDSFIFGYGFVYVIDKATHNCQPLCNKNNCLHDKETDYEKKLNCNAFLNTIGYDSLVYYNNSLYFNTETDYEDKDGNLFTQYEIYKLSLDGTGRELVYSTADFRINSIKIHRGYIYLDSYNFDKEGAASRNNMVIYRISADGKGELTELFPLYKYEDVNLTDMRFYGNHVFLCIDQPYEVDGEIVPVSSLIRYDLQTDEWEILSDKFNNGMDGFFTIFNDKLVFGNGSKIYECDFNGDNQKEILDCTSVLDGYQYYNPLTNDGENIIITAGNDDESSDRFIFVDKNYKAKVYKIPSLTSIEIGCDSNVLIYYNQNNLTLNLVDKSKLGDNTPTEELYTFSE